MNDLETLKDLAGAMRELARAVDAFPERVVQQWHLLQAAATGGALFWFLLGVLAALLGVRLTRRGA